MSALAGQRIWVAGHNGLVGSAVTRALRARGIEPITIGRPELDLMRQADVEAFVAEARPDSIVLAAAHVGGILANDRAPADFLFDNLVIGTNVFGAAHRSGVDRLLFLGSNCIYPRMAPQPISEDALLTGPLEPTNEWYAIAKIAGIRLADSYRKQFGRDYISAMPVNLHGPGDNFDLETGHMLAALIRKAHEAKLRGERSIVVWGTGTPRREFMHADDCADALLFLLEHFHEPGPINVGHGSDMPIIDIARLVCDVVGFTGAVELDPSKPDGTPRKLLSNARLEALGWRASGELREGIERTYRWYVEHGGAAR